MLETAMTSMELPGREMGQRAADMILEDIEAADDEKPSVQHMVFGTKLIERDDVGKDSQMGIFQIVDKALLLQGFAIVGTAFLI